MTDPSQEENPFKPNRSLAHSPPVSSVLPTILIASESLLYESVPNTPPLETTPLLTQHNTRSQTPVGFEFGELGPANRVYSQETGNLLDKDTFSNQDKHKVLYPEKVKNKTTHIRFRNLGFPTGNMTSTNNDNMSSNTRESIGSIATNAVVADRLVLNSLLDSIPFYNGDIKSLPVFTTRCSMLYASIDPQDRPLFLSKFLTRIPDGLFMELCQKERPNSWEDIEVILKNKTSKSTQSVEVLTTQLKNMSQRYNESILEFGQRVRNLVTELTELQCSRSTFKDAAVKNAYIEDNDELARNAFKRGLANKQIRWILSIGKAKGLQETIEMANQIGTDLELENQSERANNGRVICQLCKRAGHTADKCRPVPSTSANHNDYRQKKCNYCGRMGHEEFECRTKQFAQTRQQLPNNSNYNCYYCKENGHLANNCPNRNPNNNANNVPRANNNANPNNTNGNANNNRPGNSQRVRRTKKKNNKNKTQATETDDTLVENQGVVYEAPAPVTTQNPNSGN